MTLQKINKLRPKKKHTHCKLCHGSKVKEKYILSDVTVGECQNCSLKFVVEDFSEAELIDAYSSEKAINFWLAPAEKRNFAKFKKRLSEIRELYRDQLKRPRLLDGGCGVGEFCYLASQDGIKSTGIDISAPMINIARKRYGRYAEYSATDIKNMNGTFDIITLWDVIEHCKNPHQVISSCKSLLSKNGLLCISTPNSDSFYDKTADKIYYLNKKIGGKMLEQRYSQGHLQLWSQSTLKRLLEDYYGFKIIMFKPLSELSCLPSCYVGWATDKKLFTKSMKSIDWFAEKLWLIKNKVLVYARK